MKYYHKCEHCGNIETAHVFPMSRWLANAFCKLYTEYVIRKRSNMSWDIWIDRWCLDLDSSQYTHFRLLRLRWLARSSEKWRKPTKLWEDWFFDRCSIDDRICIMSNKRLEKDHEARKTATKQPAPVALSSVIERPEYFWYKQLIDYRLEMPSSFDLGQWLFTPDDFDQCDQ